MYLPPHFVESRPEMLRQLMHEHGLATLVTLGSDGLAANHIPLLYDPDDGPAGTLRGHVARANHIWQDFSPHVEALAVFQGPQHYISPALYPTKAETGRVVPTFNYLVVHAYGPLTIVDDVEWLRAFVSRLTDRFEADRPDDGAPRWKVTDAPSDFIDGQLRAIVGIEIPVTRLLGKWKVSQNRPFADRRGVVRGLHETNDPRAAEMAGWVDEALHL